MTYVLGPGWGFQHARIVKAEDLGFSHADFESLELDSSLVEDGKITFEFKPFLFEFEELTIRQLDFLVSCFGTSIQPIRAYQERDVPRCLRPTPWTKE